MINKDFSDRLKRHFYLHNHSRNAFFHPFMITVAISLALWGLFLAFSKVDIWEAWMLAGGNSMHFCEKNRWDMLIIQPSNTWSNMGYLLVGLVLVSIGLKDHFYKGREDLNNFMARFPAFTLLIGGAMLWLFFGSFLYHASMTKTFQIMDITGIYAVLIALFTYNAFKAFPFIRIGNKLQSSHKLLLSLGLAVNLLFVIEVWKWNVNVVFPILIGVFFALNLFNLKRQIILKMYKKYMFSSFLTLMVAGTIWILDRSNLFCMPESIFQGHALWHLLTAAAVLLLYLYYRSEEVDIERLEASYQRK